LRYLHREGVLGRDLSTVVESSQKYKLSEIPRSISWEQVRLMLEAVDCRTILGRRDYAILLLIVTYGLRAREIAALTLDDIEWKRNRFRVPERKAIVIQNDCDDRLESLP
jgi:site-specific recombinase XerD